MVRIPVTVLPCQNGPDLENQALCGRRTEKNDIAAVLRNETYAARETRAGEDPNGPLQPKLVVPEKYINAETKVKSPDPIPT